MFVTRTKTTVLVTRARDPWSPRLSTTANPFLKDKGKRIKDETITWLRSVFVFRDRAGPPRLTTLLKFEAYYRYGRWLARELLKDKGKRIKDKFLERIAARG